ncbi:MAG: hypothetical protein Q7U23_16765 [Methylococcales bacterium]|nr:hypothetical protein [Methylococcales bacterium]
MKKIFLLAAAVILFSPLSYADHDGYGRGGYGRGGYGGGWGHREHYHGRRYQPQGRYYAPPPPVVYYQPPPRYYQQPPVRYYQQPPVQYYPQPQQYRQNSLRLSW